MKKRKQPEQAPEFNNTPFRSLKGLKTQPGQDRKPAKTPARKADRAEDEDLFRRAMAGARPLDAADEEDPGEKQAVLKREPEREERDDSGLFLQAMQKIGTSFREDRAEREEEEPRQSPSSRMKQLKRGTLRITAELDLHGHLRDQALIRLEHFISAAVARRDKAVLVITGKGINSPEGPVLQGAVADWLRGKGKAMVAEFAAAPRDEGGSGAFVVFLKHK